MVIQVKMPRARRRVILPCLAVIAGVTLTGPAWKEVPVSASSGELAITASGAAVTGLETLLNGGGADSAAPARHTSDSPALVAAAAGADDQQFYQLGKLLVRDGLSSTIINLSREMNGWWYEWSEWHAPSSELDAFIRAWRHVVTAMRSVPGEHFKFLWTIYPEGQR
jgi:hypothetical protein